MQTLTFRDSGHAGEEEDRCLQRTEECAGARKKEVADAAIGEGEAQGCVGEYLRVEVHQERAYGVLVGV